MVKVFDRQIHKDDFRLRILVTNGCNKNCWKCLNDFQEKPEYGKSKFLHPVVGKEIIDSYCNFCDEKGINAQIEFSGGEPGTYTSLKDIVSYSKHHNAFVKINTNGCALFQKLEKFVDCWHIGVTTQEDQFIEKIKEVQGQVQFVVTMANLHYVKEIVDYYGSYGIPIKLFTDFFSYGRHEKIIEKEIVDIITTSQYVVKTRYTGIQENRGPVCKDCKRKCVTLKALWVFPDGKISPCPQGRIEPKHFSTNKHLNHLIESVFIGHSRKK